MPLGFYTDIVFDIPFHELQNTIIIFMSIQHVRSFFAHLYCSVDIRAGYRVRKWGGGGGGNCLLIEPYIICSTFI